MQLLKEKLDTKGNWFGTKASSLGFTAERESDLSLHSILRKADPDVTDQFVATVVSTPDLKPLTWLEQLHTAHGLEESGACVFRFRGGNPGKGLPSDRLDSFEFAVCPQGEVVEELRGTQLEVARLVAHFLANVQHEAWLTGSARSMQDRG